MTSSPPFLNTPPQFFQNLIIFILSPPSNSSSTVTLISPLKDQSLLAGTVTAPSEDQTVTSMPLPPPSLPPSLETVLHRCPVHHPQSRDTVCPHLALLRLRHPRHHPPHPCLPLWPPAPLP
uniref:Uncharacterized protein n=1 Tax=Kalanchoe fedtschenkoi TaxID=63787 RepID=A0A7N0T8Y1_KALFE